jgi:5-methylcytosine-specific restriction endonuclease McrA
VIPVKPAEPPSNFNELVRQKGLDALAELVGETRSKPRPGPKRKAAPYRSREEIPPDRFPPLWRDVLPAMLSSYRRLCAYLALYIEHGTGSPTVDHVVPKSKAWDQVYEWSNYRLACALVNSVKNDAPLVLDPFTIDSGLFALEFDECQVIAGPTAKGEVIERVETTIQTLGLSSPECCAARREYHRNYQLGPGNDGIDLKYLERRAPFIAWELRRLGKLLRGDT